MAFRDLVSINCIFCSSHTWLETPHNLDFLPDPERTFFFLFTLFFGLVTCCTIYFTGMFFFPLPLFPLFKFLNIQFKCCLIHIIFSYQLGTKDPFLLHTDSTYVLPHKPSRCSELFARYSSFCPQNGRLYQSRKCILYIFTSSISSRAVPCM